jgi:SAM-dependent methyltransferase
MSQAKQAEWHDQWSTFEDNERALLNEWIAPATLADFRGKSVLECGCGGGQHTAYLAEVAGEVVAVDLNTVDIARQRNAGTANVSFIDADIASMDLGRRFDVVVCIGVIHHTDDPDRTFTNLVRHVKPGGRLIVWAYSQEGNFLVAKVVEPLRHGIIRHLSRAAVARLAEAITLLLYPIVWSVYLIPQLRMLPYFDYFRRWRGLSFRRNVLNVFDKLNAPHTDFISRERANAWMRGADFAEGSIVVRHHLGVSYTLVGFRRETA